MPRYTPIHSLISSPLQLKGYGLLYNWYAVVNSRGLAPTGWYIMSDAQWTELTDYLGGLSVAGGKLKEIRNSHWNRPNTGATDEVGFTALPGGRRSSDGQFLYIRDHGSFWTSNIPSPYYRIMYFNNATVHRNVLSTLIETTGMSVRCASYHGTVQDMDGNSYDTVIIGNKEFTIQNYRCSRYANGYGISNLTDNAAWAADTYGAMCYYDNNIANVTTYGRLYNWPAINNAFGFVKLMKDSVTQPGWRIPTGLDFEYVEDYLGLPIGGKLKETGTVNWLTPNTGAINTTGFTARPGGYRINNGNFSGKGSNCNIWTDVTGVAPLSYVRMDYDSDVLYFVGDYSAEAKKNGYSVRCVRDIETQMTDQDGNIYDSVKIGNHLITKTNLKTTHYNDGTLMPNLTDNSAWATDTIGARCAYNNDNSYI